MSSQIAQVEVTPSSDGMPGAELVQQLLNWGQMVALRCGEIVRVPMAEAVGTPKLVDPALYHGVAEHFFAG